jgi:hypothetical protein
LRTSSATGEWALAFGSRKTRTPRPSKKAIPQPSPCTSVRPPRAWKPAKEKQMSVGVLQFIPSSWHMIVIFASRYALDRGLGQNEVW